MFADATTAQGANNGQNGANNNHGLSSGAPSQDNQTNGAAGNSGLNAQMVRPRVAKMELTEIKVRALTYRYIRILV
jgi:hypothetical protein